MKKFRDYNQTGNGTSNRQVYNRWKIPYLLDTVWHKPNSTTPMKLKEQQMHTRQMRKQHWATQRTDPIQSRPQTTLITSFNWCHDISNCNNKQDSNPIIMGSQLQKDVPKSWGRTTALWATENRFDTRLGITTTLELTHNSHNFNGRQWRQWLTSMTSPTATTSRASNSLQK